MKFKPGDLVIKNTGGNKMRILDYKENGVVNCVWATEVIHNDTFNEEELVLLTEYDSILINEKRDDLISEILKKES